MKNDPLKMKRRSAQQAATMWVDQSYFRFLFQLSQVQVQVHLFTLIQLQYNNKEKKGRRKKQS